MHDRSLSSKPVLWFHTKENEFEIVFFNCKMVDLIAFARLMVKCVNDYENKNAHFQTLTNIVFFFVCCIYAHLEIALLKICLMNEKWDQNKKEQHFLNVSVNMITFFF